MNLGFGNTKEYHKHCYLTHNHCCNICSSLKAIMFKEIYMEYDMSTCVGSKKNNTSSFIL